MEKLYFSDYNTEVCYSLQYHTEQLGDGEKEITLVEAIPDNETKEFIWCCYHDTCGEKSECNKKSCADYTSSSGRGVCRHRGKLYNHGELVTIKIS